MAARARSISARDGGSRRSRSISPWIARMAAAPCLGSCSAMIVRTPMSRNASSDEPIESTRPACSLTPWYSRDAWPLPRSEEHTSELQSRLHLVCRLLLEKKKQKKKTTATHTNKSEDEERRT